jgi:hypothetical protein
MMDQIVFLAASHQLVVVAEGVRAAIPRSALKTVDRGVLAAGLADFEQEVATLTPEAQAHQDRVIPVVIVQTIMEIREVAAGRVRQGKIVRA